MWIMFLLLLSSTPSDRGNDAITVERAEVNTITSREDGSMWCRQIILYRWGRCWRGGKVGYGVTDYSLVGDSPPHVYSDGDFKVFAWKHRVNGTQHIIRVPKNALHYTETFNDPEQDNLKMVPFDDRISYFPRTSD